MGTLGWFFALAPLLWVVYFGVTCLIRALEKEERTDSFNPQKRLTRKQEILRQRESEQL